MKTTNSGSSNTSSYKYEPLESASSIRLIELLPGFINDHVACKISEHDITKVPCYHALSYYWGDPKLTRTICINECEHPLHENLWQFFQQMREDGKFGFYWTDALCLN
jgi:hypothetical protein